MNYSQVKQLAVDYSDRTDVEPQIDSFMRIVEARVDKRLRTREQYKRAVIKQVADQVYYGLPSDFADLRDIQTANGTLDYYSPKQMNEAQASGSTSACAYTIIANQLQVWPVTEDLEMEVVYSSKIPELTDTDSTNWLSVSSPDIYVFGILVEIAAYTKDGASAQLWNTRFQEELASLEQKDQLDKWSGTSLVVRLG